MVLSHVLQPPRKQLHPLLCVQRLEYLQARLEVLEVPQQQQQLLLLVLVEEQQKVVQVV